MLKHRSNISFDDFSTHSEYNNSRKSLQPRFENIAGYDTSEGVVNVLHE